MFLSVYGSMAKSNALVTMNIIPNDQKIKIQKCRATDPKSRTKIKPLEPKVRRGV